MAVTRREFIFSAFLSSVLSVLLIVIAVSSDSWVVGTASAPDLFEDNTIKYGLFRGELVLNNLATPNYNTLYMICIADLNACAVSCKTDAAARQAEVAALAQGFRPSTSCASVTEVDTSNPFEKPPVLNYGVYVSTLFFLFVKLLVNVLAAVLAIVNATMNPTEPIFGLPGCLAMNLVAFCIGFLVMMMFGITWAATGLSEHLALSYIALGHFVPNAALGYSYWLVFVATLCCLVNAGLILLRAYLLERDPPPPTIKLENHSDGTIFLY